MKIIVITVLILNCFFNVINCNQPLKCPYQSCDMPQTPQIHPQDPQCLIPKLEVCSIHDKYRTLDGSCNNLLNSNWGMPNTRYRRLLHANYDDDMAAPRHKSVTGGYLPLARTVSRACFTDRNHLDSKYTNALVAFGQFVSHDLSFLASSSRNSNPCCNDGILKMNKLNVNLCNPIIVPSYFPENQIDGKQCDSFTKTLTDHELNCPKDSYNNKAEQITLVTSFTDLSTVYRNNKQSNHELRTFKGGELIKSDNNGYPRLPLAGKACAAGSLLCFNSGDARSNQNPQLISIHTIFHNEHNRLCQELAKWNPHWNDYQLFEEARRINIAQYQHIIYWEYLPYILGTKNMLNYNLIYDNQNCGIYTDEYNPNVSPAVLNECAHGAFRYLHSQITNYIHFTNSQYEKEFEVSFGTTLGLPDVFTMQGTYDKVIRGMVSQQCEANDRNFVNQTTKFFKRRDIVGGKVYGEDLRAIDIHRDREHGLRSYNDYRALCGLPKAKDFDDFGDFIGYDDIEILKKLYAHADDVDLSVGGAMEAHVYDSQFGPTFLCLMTEQFYKTRVGDRFYYTNNNKHTGFTKEQLCEIRKMTLAALMCKNGDSITAIQPKVFQIPNSESGNPIISCSKIPHLDLSKWAEPKGSNTFTPI